MTTIETAITPRLFNLSQRLAQLVDRPFAGRIEAQATIKVEAVLEAAIEEYLRPYPPQRPAGEPRIWSNNPIKNAIGRAWYWVNIGQKPYQRTGAMGRAWRGQVEFRDRQARLKLVHPDARASYVYGALAYNFARPPMHEATGWPRTDREGNQALKAALSQARPAIGIALREALGDALRGRR